MSIYTEIERLFVTEYDRMVRHLAQQTGSKLRAHVTEQSVQGKDATFNRMGSRTAGLVSSRHPDTPENNQDFSVRKVVLFDYADGDIVDSEDKARMLLDPTNKIVEAMGMALGRKIDDIIIAAATGSATAVDETGTTSSVTLPSSQVIDEDYGTANSDLTLDKIIKAKSILMENNVDVDTERLVLAVDAKAHNALLSETKATSSDYVGERVIESGRLTRLMGFEVVICNKLANAPTSEGFVNALAFVPSAIGLAVGQDKTTFAAVDPTKSFNMRLMAKMSMGAVRIEDEKVVRIECYRA